MKSDEYRKGYLAGFQKGKRSKDKHLCTDDVKLRKCPFCGSEAVCELDRGIPVIICKTCGVHITTAGTFNELAKIWNRRKDEL